MGHLEGGCRKNEEKKDAEMEHERDGAEAAFHVGNDDDVAHGMTGIGISKSDEVSSLCG